METGNIDIADRVVWYGRCWKKKLWQGENEQRGRRSFKRCEKRCAKDISSVFESGKLLQLFFLSTTTTTLKGTLDRYNPSFRLCFIPLAPCELTCFLSEHNPPPPYIRVVYCELLLYDLDLSRHDVRLFFCAIAHCNAQSHGGGYTPLVGSC